MTEIFCFDLFLHTLSGATHIPVGEENYVMSVKCIQVVFTELAVNRGNVTVNISGEESFVMQVIFAFWKKNCNGRDIKPSWCISIKKSHLFEGVVKGIFVNCKLPLLFPVKCEMAFFPLMKREL